MSNPSSTDAIDHLIDTYCAAWNEPDADRRHEILNQVWAGNATYTDPTVRAEGVDQLVAHIIVGFFGPLTKQ